jgi:hypothetical protein
VEYFEQLDVRQNIEKHHANKADSGSKDTYKHRNDATDRKKRNGPNQTRIWKVARFARERAM